MGRKYIDYTGKIINNVFIKGVDPNSGGAGKHKRWICLCPYCNETFTAQSNHIRDGILYSCKKCNTHYGFENLSGQTFGYLYVKERLYDIKNGTKYLCLCKCGNQHIVDGRHLKSGSVQSCGCLKSSYEDLITKILTKNNIKFEKEKIFPECKDQKVLPFDFYIPELQLLIEMQGEQHFKEVAFWGGEDGLKLRQYHDQLKQDFCKSSGYNLLIIKYNEDIEQRINEEIVWPLRKQKD